MRYVLVICAGVLAVATTAAADIYRWTDKAGDVHYGDRPPAGVAAERVRPGLVSSQPSAQAVNPPADPEADDQRTAQIRQDQCKKARKRLATYRNADRLMISESEDGQRREMTAEERVDTIARAEKNARQLCQE